EDGIRDDLVTGVQTCALPIYDGTAAKTDCAAGWTRTSVFVSNAPAGTVTVTPPFVVKVEVMFGVATKPSPSGVTNGVSGMIAIRSEGRRVGKGCAGGAEQVGE